MTHRWRKLSPPPALDYPKLCARDIIPRSREPAQSSQGPLSARLNGQTYMLATFGLRREPFLDTADPAFYYDTLPGAYGRRRLAECLASGRGLAVVVGPIGAGKTTLCNAVQQTLLEDERNAVGLILDPTFENERELLEAIAACFGFVTSGSPSARAIKEDLKRALFGLVQSDRQAVLFIDEAQLLSETLLEPLRSLLNYQLDDRKLLSIVLSGQMELAAMLTRRPNLSDRIALWLELKPLSEPEAIGLLNHRLRCAGYLAEVSPFTDDAMHALWQESRGVPRRLTTLAREAMEVAAQFRRSSVTHQDVVEAAQRVAPLLTLQPASAPAAVQLSPQKPWWRWWRRAS